MKLTNGINEIKDVSYILDKFGGVRFFYVKDGVFTNHYIKAKDIKNRNTYFKNLKHLRKYL